jgi:hypothetical protein
MANQYWFDSPEQKTQLTVAEQEILKDEKPFIVRGYGNLDQTTLEAIIVGHMVVDARLDIDDPQKAKMDKIINSGISESWFERSDLARLFVDAKTHYKKYGRIGSIDEMGECYIERGNTPTQSAAYKHKIRICRGTLHAWRIGIDILIERFWAHHSQKITEKCYHTYKKDSENPAVGPVKAAAALSEGLKKAIRLPQTVEIKVYDLVSDYSATKEWLSDMKDHPEKHKGALCGIKAIDQRTHGFRKGHLSVIVGSHGGFKTTLMLNIAYGLYMNGHNVLYVSLEMEKDIVQTKLLCRATGVVSYSRLYQGRMSDPKDWGTIRVLEQELVDPNLPSAERRAKEERLKDLRGALSGVMEGQGKEDAPLLDKAVKELENGRKNKFRTMVAGQSKKLKASQIEAFIIENMGDFKPDVVFIDYLALMDSETPYPDRPDLGFGEICQYAREMGKNHGFAVVTAAQLKRSALERLKKNGVDTPEKAELDTGDIEDSNKIGANADDVFILWREPGGNSIRVFTAKARYGEKDTNKGETVQVDHETCTISDNVRDTSSKASSMTMADANRAVDKIKMGIPSYVKTDMTESDDIFSNPTIDQPLDGDGSGDDGPEAPSDGIDI